MLFASSPGKIIGVPNGCSTCMPIYLGWLCRSKEEILEEIKQLQNEMTKLDESSQVETAASKEN